MMRLNAGFRSRQGWLSYPAETIGIQPLNAFYSTGVQRLPTDPIGNTTVTFDGVVVGSAVQIESQDGTTVLHNSMAASSSFSVVMSVYSTGSPLNSWRIKIRKGSAAPYYRPYETLATAVVGAMSIYVSQIPDD